jgi:hypothetical protein
MRATRLLSLLLALALLASFVAAPVVAQPSAPAATAQPQSGGANVAAGFANVFYVPGKAIFCACSAALWVGMLAITFGALYEDATQIVAGGCGGKWTVEGRDLEPVLQSAAP